MVGESLAFEDRLKPLDEGIHAGVVLPHVDDDKPRRPQ
jgi:hypothetical protein